jgi:hypothetical protein
MIVETLKQIKNSSSIKKIHNNKAAKAKFSLSESEAVESSATISSINPFLFLQEIDEYKESQKALKEVGDKILQSLNELRLALMNCELKEEHIATLKNTLENNRKKFKFSELQTVIDDIILRSEVELAKIEMINIKAKRIY